MYAYRQRTANIFRARRLLKDDSFAHATSEAVSFSNSSVSGLRKLLTPLMQGIILHNFGNEVIEAFVVDLASTPAGRQMIAEHPGTLPIFLFEYAIVIVGLASIFTLENTNDFISVPPLH